MFKCCICGQDIQRPSLWACANCYGQFELALSPDDWPEWAKSQKRREESRRRYKPGYGVSGSELSYAPYSRLHENISYRVSNNVRKRENGAVRVQADDLLYSSGDDQAPADMVKGDSSEAQRRVIESLPVELRDRLWRHVERQVILADAIAALPLISQRAIRGLICGYSEREMADAEGIAVDTMGWLLEAAKERLADILRAKVGADDGARFVGGNGSHD
jgi:DNA-directed RNA polymerase specialized sigma24 family protein